MGWVVFIVIVLGLIFSGSGSSSSGKTVDDGRSKRELIKKYGERNKSLGVVERNRDIINNYLEQLEPSGYRYSYRSSHNPSEFTLSRDCYIDIYNIEGCGDLINGASTRSVSQIKDFEASDKSVFKGLYQVLCDTFSKRKKTVDMKYSLGTDYSNREYSLPMKDLFNKEQIERFIDSICEGINEKDKEMDLLLSKILDKLSDSEGKLYYMINDNRQCYSEIATIIEKYFVEDSDDDLIGRFFGKGFKKSRDDNWNGENIEDIINNILVRGDSDNISMFMLDGSGIVAHELLDKFFMNDNNHLLYFYNKDISSSQTFYFENEASIINNWITTIKTKCNQLINKRSKKISDFKNRINELILSHNNGLKGLKKLYEGGDKLGIESGIRYIIDGLYFDNFADKDFELLYDKESKSLIIEYHFPPLDDLPRLKEVKQNGKEMLFSDAAMKKLYDKYIFSICIRILYEIYNADYKNYIDGIVFNGIVTSIDKSNGHERTDCILSVSTEKKDIKDIILENIDPKETIRSLHGVCATSLSTLTPVSPISTIDKNDKRFVEGYNVIDSLDDSVNIACMDWQDFENLIRDLFEKIYGEKGGEVKVTQASRDGGVDAVAFDPDPVTGGKILIQAKRYTNVVGVGAVRDLAGAVHHEGAMKGILVTTSNFGSDAMKFVAKEPISLINGQNLLSLLNKYGYHAYIDIKEARKILKEEEKKKQL